MDEVTRRQAQLIANISRLINSALDSLNAYSQGQDPIPAANSPAATELAIDLLSNGTRSPSDALNAAYMEGAVVQIHSAGFVLRGLAQLFVEGIAPFGFQIVARSVLMYSAQAWWLLNPDIDASTRIAHYLNWKVKNAWEMNKLGLLTGQSNGYQPDKGTLDLYVTTTSWTARDLGIKWTAHPTGKLAEGWFGDDHWPPDTELVSRFLTWAGHPYGTEWFRYLSAIAHGKSFGLLRHLQVAPSEDQEDVATLVVALTPKVLIDTAGLALLAYLGSVKASELLLGGETEDLDGIEAEVTRSLGVWAKEVGTA